MSGLSTAICLKQRGYQVTVIASGQKEETTSSAAAAFWYPFWVGPEPDHNWYVPEWAADTYDELEALLNDPSSGVTTSPLIEYFDSSLTEDQITETIDAMWWSTLPKLGFRRLETEELRDAKWTGVPPVTFLAGITFRTLVVNMSIYLDFLTDRLGDEIQSGRVRSIASNEHIPLNDLLNEFDFVINCAGLGARDICDDFRTIVRKQVRERVDALEAQEGIVVRIPPIQGVTNVVLIHTGDEFGGGHPLYIVPRGGYEPDIVLGGTIELVEKKKPRHFPLSTISPQERETVRIAHAIQKRCAYLDSRVGEVTALSVGVGYRPKRTPRVRLEPDGRAAFRGKVIHNYGHGGGGVTLSWGCAMRVADWVDRLSAG